MWLLPSRARPASLARFFDAYSATGGTTPGMVLIDHEDWTDRWAFYNAIELPAGWHIRETKGCTQAEKIAEVWEEVKDCVWFGLIGDDCVPMTAEWDRKLVAKLDGANIVSCNDGWQAPSRLGNCWLMAGDLVRAVGYIFPPGLQHLYVDDVWEIIGKEARCWSCSMDVLVEHRHVLTGKADTDDTHRIAYGAEYPNRVDGGFWLNDGAVFRDWCQNDRRRAVAAARALRPSAPAIVETQEDREARMAYAQTRRVMFLTPIGFRPTWQFADSMIKTIHHFNAWGIEWERRWFMGNSDLPQARNVLAAMFLEARSTKDGQPFTDALLIDDDMRWEPVSALRLVASKQMVVGAVGRKRDPGLLNNDPRAWCFYTPTRDYIRDELGAVTSTETGVLVGAAFLRVRREVFEQMIAEYPERKIDLPNDPRVPQSLDPYYYEFFARPRGGGGEDFYFCREWHALGGQVWVDPSIELGHVGEYEYKGALSELMPPVEGWQPQTAGIAA